MGLGTNIEAEETDIFSSCSLNEDFYDMQHHDPSSQKLMGGKTRWKYDRKAVVFYILCLPAWKTIQWNLDYPGNWPEGLARLIETYG